MPVTTQSIQTNPYLVGNFSAPPAIDSLLPAVAVPPPALPLVTTGYRNLHTLYPTDDVRNTLTITPPTNHDARHTLLGAANPGGDVIYLKYFDDKISSVRLPCPAPANVELFVTDTLTGCKFFVDSVAGSTDLIAYHANTHAHSAGPAADCDLQTPAASGVLDQLHADAVNDYARHGVVLANAADCAKVVYYANGGQAERRKRAQGRGEGKTFKAGQAIFAGGCTIVGIPTGASWAFYYQLYGTVDYRRPGIVSAKDLLRFNYLRKRIRHGRDHAATFDKFEVVGWARIF